MEDVSMGMWVEKFNMTRQPVEYRHDVRFYQAGCFDGYFTAHYQSPQHMICLWRKLQSGSTHCCNVRWRWRKCGHCWSERWSARKHNSCTKRLEAIRDAEDGLEECSLLGLSYDSFILLVGGLLTCCWFWHLMDGCPRDTFDTCWYLVASSFPGLGIIILGGCVQKQVQSSIYDIRAFDLFRLESLW